MYDIVIIPGDGSGPELVRAARQCLDATGVSFNWIEKEAGAITLEKENNVLPDHVLGAIKQTGRAFKGPIITPVGKGFRSANVALRQTLDLYACVRPCRTLPGIDSPLANNRAVDIVIIRENTEDLYAGIEFETQQDNTKSLINTINSLQKKSKPIPIDAGISIKPITEKASIRIFEFAFEYAKRYNRKKVTCVTKSNIMKFSDGLFMETGEKIASQYPEIAYNHVLVDALCMKLVQMPEQFDVLVLPNLYGDIVSDLGAGLVGGLGVAPGSNTGNYAVVYEATHGAAPEFAGQDKLNPTALILCGIMLLQDLQEHTAADKLEQALLSVLQDKTHVTFDLFPRDKAHLAVSTSAMTREIIKKL